MPYPHAHYWILLLLVLTGVAFSPSYFLKLADAPLAHHVHGLSATAWFLLLALQSWLIHSGRRVAHRAFGLSSIGLAAVFLAGSLMVMDVTAESAIAGDSAFARMFVRPLIGADLFAAVGFAALVGLALAERRDVQLHARLMLATALLVMPPVLARLFPMVVPGLGIRSIEELPRFAYSAHLGLLVTAAICLWLYAKAPRVGWPWLVPAAASVASGVFFAFLGDSWLANGIIDASAALSASSAAALGCATGLVACAVGWIAGSRRGNGRARKAAGPDSPPLRG
jgi:uncharacterized membrane protein YozB (DUF420 family)